MSKSKNQGKFEAAVELKLLSRGQLEAIELEQQASNYPPLEIAIRKGFLNGMQLGLLEVLADPMSVVPGYRIDGFLGQGGVGTVYKATQLRMDRPVAIKTISRAAARNDLTPKRFEREAKIIGRLRHPNIISAFDFGIHNQQLYLVMEFIDGIDAEKLLTQQRRISELHAWFIAQQVCHALDNAKQHDVIHRDIKPANLILTAAPAGFQLPAEVPFVKVADFGLAKFNSKQLDATITLEHAVSGTPFYMSPEQIKAREIDHRSDIYSLGSTIWHLITGAPPVVGAGPIDVLTQKIKLEDEWLDDTPDDISNVGFQLLQKMCRFDRQQRIDDYTTLNQEIESVIDRLGRELSSQDSERKFTDAPFTVSAKVTTIHEFAKTFTDDGDFGQGEATEEFTSNATARTAITDQTQPPTSSAGELPHRNKRVLRWLVLALGAVVLPVIIYVSLPTNGQKSGSSENRREQTVSPGSVSEHSFTRLTEFAGPPLFLFDGRNIDPTQKFSGTWEPDQDPVEGAAILSGIGSRNFRCEDTAGKPLQYFRFVCGFRHNTADTIGFRLLSNSDQNQAQKTHWEVNVNPEKATLNHASSSSSCSVQQFDDEKNFGYHQFRIEFQPDHWRIEIDDGLLGQIPKPDNGSTSEYTVQLFVTGTGPAHFEQIRFRPFKSN